MKKMIMMVLLGITTLVIGGCDIIQEEIERAESIELEDFVVDIADRSLLLKITSSADEQVIEDVVVNDVQYELIPEGDDWYLLENVPVETSYVIGDVYYRTGVGVRLSFDVDFDITIDDAVDQLPTDMVTIIDDSVQIGDYTFSESADELIDIASEKNFTVDELDTWVWVIIEDEMPVYAVFTYADTLYVVEAPDTADEYID